jgi:hypothetical protein
MRGTASCKLNRTSGALFFAEPFKNLHAPGKSSYKMCASTQINHQVDTTPLLIPQEIEEECFFWLIVYAQIQLKVRLTSLNRP